MTEHERLAAVVALRVFQTMRLCDLTQRQLAARAELDERTIRRILDGKGTTITTLEKIALALETEVTALLKIAA